MPEYKAIRNKRRCPSHPGAAIEDILQDIKKSKTEIAELLGISRQHLYDILSAKKPVLPQQRHAPYPPFCIYKMPD